jgi:hypothetical protein
VITAKPYRYQGRQGWDPASLGPIPNPAQRRDARAAEFARLREQEQPLTVAEASRRLNVTPDTGRGYERARRGGAS